MNWTPRRTALALAILAAVGYLGVRRPVSSRLIARFRASVSGYEAQSTGETYGVPLEDLLEVSLTSADGVGSNALWRPPDSPAGDAPRVTVLAHGLAGSKSKAYMVRTVSAYANAGYGVLALGLRSAGHSSLTAATLGYQEVEDVRGAISWLQEQGFETGEMILHGFSAGGAAVMRVAPGSGIAAVVEESGFADLPRLLGQFIPGGGGTSLASSAVRLAAGLLGVGFEPREVRPQEDAARLYREGTPLFVIHSSDDGVVPFEHARMLEAAHPDAEVWEVEGSGHIAASTHPEYQERLLDFLSRTAKREVARE